MFDAPLLAAASQRKYIIDRLGAKPAIAFGLRRLYSQYRGPLITLQRASDNATVDIYPTIDGELDVGAMISFLGATGTGTVRRVYDQMGGAAHWEQSYQPAQPRIVNAGVLDKYNGRPAMYQSTAMFLRMTFATGNSYAISYTARWISDTNGRILHDPSAPLLFGWQVGLYTRAYLANGFNYQQYNQDTNAHVHSIRVVSTSVISGFRDGSALTQDNNVASAAWTGFDSNGGVAGTPSECAMMELFVYSGTAANDADLKILDADQKRRFNIA